MSTHPPVPPISGETAMLPCAKLRMAEDGWNSPDPGKVALELGERFSLHLRTLTRIATPPGCRTLGNKMHDDEETPWEGHSLAGAAAFARKCFDLNRSNPYKEPALDGIINDLMTELWDNGFSQSEIRSAFEKAIIDMPRYAAGEERRGGGVRSKKP